jgi:hypothetical protein
MKENRTKCLAEDCENEISDFFPNKDFCDDCFDNKVMPRKMDSTTGEYLEGVES